MKFLCKHPFFSYSRYQSLSVKLQSKNNKRSIINRAGSEETSTKKEEELSAKNKNEQNKAAALNNAAAKNRLEIESAWKSGCIEGRDHKPVRTSPRDNLHIKPVKASPSMGSKPP